MVTCPHCAAAKLRTWGQYGMHCTGCRARSVARSLIAWRALAQNDTQARIELRHMVSRVLPHVGYEEARAMVLGWWESDRKEATC